MSWLGWYGRAALVLAGLGSSLPAGAQGPPALRQPVQLAPGRRPLGAVLAELSRQGRLPLSYSSSLVPLAHRCRVRPGPARPAGEVLREVLAAEHLAYGWLAGQVVLWPDHAPAPPGVTAVNGEPARPTAASAGQEQAGTAPRPSANATPGLLPGASTTAPLVAASPTSHPVASRSPRSKAGSGAAILFTTRGAKVNAPTALNRPAATLGSWLVPPPVRRGQAIPKAVAAAHPPATAPPAMSMATAAGWQPGPGARYRVGAPGGGALLRISPGHVATRAILLPSAAASAHSLPQLPLQRVSLELVQPSSSLPRLLGQPAALAAAPAAALAPKRPLSLGFTWKGLYLHGEAWGSEALPVGAVAKVGVARAYLVLGGALVPAEHRAGGAWALGLGTAGRARGRFTPSLDLLHWFLPSGGDGDDGHAALTQLRPLLAWQLRREGRWALLLGPTLNLATADGHGTQRGSFGRNQWLWLDGHNEHSNVRFWPGVQAGLRF